MKEITIKNRFTGEPIFSRKAFGNTMLMTLRVALIRDIDVRCSDLSGQDLSYGHFVGKDFSKCDFTGSTLTGANFLYAKFRRASMARIVDASHTNFEGATFHRTYAANSNFMHAFFKDSIATESIFDNSDFSGCDMRSIKNRGTSWRNVITDEIIIEGTDTRIAYKWPKYKVPNICEMEPCSQCVGCTSPKKFKTVEVAV